VRDSSSSWRADAAWNKSSILTPSLWLVHFYFPFRFFFSFCFCFCSFAAATLKQCQVLGRLRPIGAYQSRGRVTPSSAPVRRLGRVGRANSPVWPLGPPLSCTLELLDRLRLAGGNEWRSQRAGAPATDANWPAWRAPNWTQPQRSRLAWRLSKALAPRPVPFSLPFRLPLPLGAVLLHWQDTGKTPARRRRAPSRPLRGGWRACADFRPLSPLGAAHSASPLAVRPVLELSGQRALPS